MNDVKKILSYGHDMYKKGVLAGAVSTISLYVSYRLLKEYWKRENHNPSNERKE